VLKDWLNEANMTGAAFYRRIRKGMTEEQAILTPKAKRFLEVV
jgi:hypothetical protein